MASCQSLQSSYSKEHSPGQALSSSSGCVGRCYDSVHLVASRISERAGCPSDPLLNDARGTSDSLSCGCCCPCLRPQHPLLQGRPLPPDAHAPAKGTCTIDMSWS